MISYYKGFITDVLVDGSGGRGLPMDVDKTLEYVEALPATHGSWLGVGIAGGLSDEGLGSLSRLTERFPNVNLDAEGRLRTPAPEDSLDTKRMRKYISIAD